MNSQQNGSTASTNGSTNGLTNGNTSASASASATTATTNGNVTSSAAADPVPDFSLPIPDRTRHTPRHHDSSASAPQDQTSLTNGGSIPPSSDRILAENHTRLEQHSDRLSNDVQATMSGFAKQIPKAVREIRLHFCQTSQPSAGVRQFVQSSYPAVKAAHPDLKFLIREASEISPRAFVRFDRGVEAQTPLEGLSEKDVGEALTRLVTAQTVGKA